MKWTPRLTSHHRTGPSAFQHWGKSRPCPPHRPLQRCRGRSQSWHPQKPHLPVLRRGKPGPRWHPRLAIPPSSSRRRLPLAMARVHSPRGAQHHRHHQLQLRHHRLAQGRLRPALEPHCESRPGRASAPRPPQARVGSAAAQPLDRIPTAVPRVRPALRVFDGRQDADAAVHHGQVPVRGVSVQH